jgi:pimeloyl-ACP methyl ester carboxylesterase
VIVRRRALLAAAAAGAATAAFAPGRKAAAQTTAQSKPPIVMVHGAWHGGWCWKRVAARLRAGGHDVFTPTLTGLGERVHLAKQRINLDTHLDDILNVLDAEELSNVILVGHSYGGMIVSGIADRAAGKLRSLVYLDAFVPANGKSCVSYLPDELKEAFAKDSKPSGKLPATMPAEALGLTNAEDIAWVKRRLTPHPYASLAQPLRLSGQKSDKLRRFYVRCSKAPSPWLDGFANDLRNRPEWKVSYLDTGHDCMITAPEDVARIVQEAA